MSELAADTDSAFARLPRHVAVIMDGNGRWARQRGLPRLAGHRAGTEALRRVIEACVEFGVPVLTIYAFSTENWKRPAHEVRGLMFLLEEVIERQLDELDANGVRLRHVGWLDDVPPHLARAIKRAVARTAANDRLVLNVAFNYGSRAELVRAVRRIVAEGLPVEAIDEACVEAHLETAGLPDPDLVIRTSGEMRLSNFLLWQAAYAELYCTDTLWPDFDREALRLALETYASRERRFGRVGAAGTGAPAGHGRRA
jgi:undecaprenyl diphosphate synthase